MFWLILKSLVIVWVLGVIIMLAVASTKSFQKGFNMPYEKQAWAILTWPHSLYLALKHWDEID